MNNDGINKNIMFFINEWGGKQIYWYRILVRFCIFLSVFACETTFQT